MVLAFESRIEGKSQTRLVFTILYLINELLLNRFVIIIFGLKIHSHHRNRRELNQKKENKIGLVFEQSLDERPIVKR